MSLQSQTIYFNNRYESVTNKWNAGLSLVEMENEYLIGGTTGHPLNEPWHQISLFKTDIEGNKIDEFVLGDTIAERDLASGSLNKVSGGYLFTGTRRQYTTNWVHDECMLVKINENLDTLWTKYYGEIVEPFDTAYLPRHLVINEVNQFIIVGTKKPYALPSKVFILKVNENGQKEWESNFGTGSYYYQGFSVIQTTDGGYAIGGYRFHIGQNETADPIIYKTDSLGNLEWEKNLGGPFDDYHPMLTLGQDGNIVAGTCYADSMAQPDVAYRKINIVKLDNQGNILWNKKYGQSITYNYLKQIRTTNDGGYIATGSIKNNYPHRSGWIFKVAENGDSLWYRQYDNLLGADSRNYLYDVIPTSDNGFAACGYVIPYPPDTGSQDAWVLKVDSLGCDTPGCATGTHVFEFPDTVGNNLKVCPNPAKDVLNIEYRTSNNEVRSYFVIYDILGRKAEEIGVGSSSGSSSSRNSSYNVISIDVSEWRKGVYLCVLMSNGKVVGRKKFVVK